VTFLQAAEEVLRSSKRPMTAREITEVAVRRGLIKTGGRSPEDTMSARLYTAALSTPIRRQYEPGPTRARRASVRWVYAPPDRSRKRMR
jgi:hypothetical protein